MSLGHTARVGSESIFSDGQGGIAWQAGNRDDLWRPVCLFCVRGARAGRLEESLVLRQDAPYEAGGCDGIGTYAGFCGGALRSMEAETPHCTKGGLWAGGEVGGVGGGLEEEGELPGRPPWEIQEWNGLFSVHRWLAICLPKLGKPMTPTDLASGFQGGSLRAFREAGRGLAPFAYLRGPFCRILEDVPSIQLSILPLGRRAKL